MMFRMRTRKQFWISALGVGSFLLASMAQAQTELSLEKVLESVKSQYRARGVAKAADAWSEAAYDAAQQNLGTWSVEAEAKVGQAQEGSGERSLGTFVSRPLRFGVDSESMRQQFQAEAKALALEGESTLAEQQLMAGQAYLRLLHYRRLVSVDETMLERLNPIFSSAERAALRGSADALALLKWNLLKQEMKASRSLAESSLELTGAELQRYVKDLPSADGMAKAKLAEPKLAAFESGNVEALPKVAALQAQSTAFASKARVFERSFEMNVGVGYEHDFKEKSHAVMARVSLPLGQGAINQATSKEALAASALSEMKVQLAKESVTRDRLLLQQKIANGQSLVDSLKARRNDVEKLYLTSIDGLRRGFADLSHVMEASEKLFALESALSQAIFDLQGDALALSVLSGDKP